MRNHVTPCERRLSARASPRAAYRATSSGSPAGRNGIGVRPGADGFRWGGVGSSPTSSSSSPAAAEALYRSLHIVQPELVQGRRLIVIDDVAATGLQLQAVERRLLEHGAASVGAGGGEAGPCLTCIRPQDG